MDERCLGRDPYEDLSGRAYRSWDPRRDTCPHPSRIIRNPRARIPPPMACPRRASNPPTMGSRSRRTMPKEDTTRKTPNTRADLSDETFIGVEGAVMVSIEAIVAGS